MKLKFISMAVFSALTLGVATNASAVTTVNGGTVHFKGEVVHAACAVNTNSFDQTVNLGQVRSERLKVDGAKSNPVGFTIELNDCDVQELSFQAQQLLVKQMFLLYKVLQRVLQQTSAFRLLTIPARLYL